MPKPYPREFRDDVVRVARRRESGVTLEQIADDFGIHPMTLSKWLRQAGVDEGERPGVTSVESAELRDAKKRIRLLEQTNEVLRRAAACLGQASIPRGGTHRQVRSDAAAQIRPDSPADRTRKELAQDLVRELRTVDASLTDSEQRMTAALDEHGTRLREIDGIGAVTAVRLIGRTGIASRFAPSTRSRPMPVSHRSRSPAATTPDIDQRGGSCPRTPWRLAAHVSGLVWQSRPSGFEALERLVRLSGPALRQR